MAVGSMEKLKVPDISEITFNVAEDKLPVLTEIETLKNLDDLGLAEASNELKSNLAEVEDSRVLLES